MLGMYGSRQTDVAQQVSGRAIGGGAQAPAGLSQIIVDTGLIVMNLYFKEVTPGLCRFDSRVDIRKRPGVGHNLDPFKALMSSGV